MVIDDLIKLKKLDQPVRKYIVSDPWHIASHFSYASFSSYQYLITSIYPVLNSKPLQCEPLLLFAKSFY